MFSIVLPNASNMSEGNIIRNQCFLNDINTINIITLIDTSCRSLVLAHLQRGHYQSTLFSILNKQISMFHKSSQGCIPPPPGVRVAWEGSASYGQGQAPPPQDRSDASPLAHEAPVMPSPPSPPPGWTSTPNPRATRGGVL